MQPANVQSKIYDYTLITLSLLLLTPSLPGDTRTIGGVSTSWFANQGDRKKTDRPSCPRLLSAVSGVEATDVKVFKIVVSLWVGVGS